MGELANRIEDAQHTEQTDVMPLFPEKRLLIELSNICNHRCLFCANSKMTRKKGFIDKNFLKRILNEAYEAGAREVGFYATGEPLVNKNLAEYIRIAKTIGFSYVYLTTNGALATKDKIEELIAAGIDSMKFSINAGTRESYRKIHGKDDFEQVIVNFQYIDEYRKKYNKNIKLYVSCILNKINESEKNILQNILKGYADEIIFINVMNVGGMMYELNNRLTLDVDTNTIRPKLPCSLLFDSVTITYEGYMSACCTDFQNYLIVADLNKVSLLEGWNGKVFQELRRRHLKKNITGTLCYNCIFNKNDKIYPLQEEYASIYEIKTFDKTDEIVRAMSTLKK